MSIVQEQPVNMESESNDSYDAQSVMATPKMKPTIRVNAARVGGLKMNVSNK